MKRAKDKWSTGDRYLATAGYLSLFAMILLAICGYGY